MSNIFEAASDLLASVRREYTSSEVSYRQLDSENAVSVAATLGSTVFHIEDVSGVVTRERAVDFLIEASVLGVEPQKGDEIIYKGGIYEVLAPNNEPVWRWTDHTHNTLRIHTKQVGFQTVNEQQHQQ